MYVERGDLEQLIQRNPGVMIKLNDVQHLAQSIEVETTNKRHIDIEIIFENSPNETRITQTPKKLTWDQQKA